jgi:flavin-dependent dehydrogenase
MRAGRRIPNVNVMETTRHEEPRVGERAVVVGASMAGLCAARVLAPRFGEVVVLDRDDLPDSPGAAIQGAAGEAPTPVAATLDDGLESGIRRTCRL